MWYHSAILDVFRPLLPGRQNGQHLRLCTFSEPDSKVEAFFTASVDQLKCLIITYRSQYALATSTILWHTTLIYLANAMAAFPADPESHIQFFMCLYGYESLRRSFNVADAIGRGLLAMALRANRIGTREARAILEHFGGFATGGLTTSSNRTSERCCGRPGAGGGRARCGKRGKFLQGSLKYWRCLETAQTITMDRARRKYR
jgi:hypothetical protein